MNGLRGCIRKDFEARTGLKVRILDQVGNLLMRHVEYVMNRITHWHLINLDGGTSNVTTFERCCGQSPEYTIAPFGAKVVAMSGVEQARSQEGRCGA